MEKYESPVFEILYFESADIVTSSSTDMEPDWEE